MDFDLTSVVVALARVSDAELAALIETTSGVPQIAPGLLAWVEHACYWELNRRGGVDFPLQLPDTTIYPSEDAVSIAAAVIIRAQFAQDERKEARGMVVLFDANVKVILGTKGNHN